MTDLSNDKIAVLRQLMVAAPDRVVLGLGALLAEGAAAGPLASVRAIVETESIDRQVRNTVLAPVEPLFGGPGGDGRLTFPRQALGLIWRALKAEQPALVREARNYLDTYDPAYPPPAALDALCVHAAQGLRTGEQADFAAVGDICNPLDIAACLDLAPIVRPASADLTDWVVRMTQERRAALRLVYRDAVAVSDDAGPRFFEMLAGQLEQPWLILRLISAVMDRPSERYLAGSELATFGERVLSDIDGRIQAVRNFRPDEGEAAGRAAGEAVHAATDEIAEFEESIQLLPGAVWSQRIAKQRKALASAVEARLKEVDDQVGKALPTQSLRFGARLVKKAPKLTAEPVEPAVARMHGLLAFADEVRASASSGGFGSTRSKMLEGLDRHLDVYIEDVLDRLRAGECEDADRARRFLDVAAGFMAFCRDERAAQIVRRRAAAA